MPATSASSSGHAKGRGGDTFYGYRPNLYDEVTDSFARLLAPPAELNVTLVKVCSLTPSPSTTVAFAHLDGDWYESTLTCLERIGPHIVRGGRFVLDDYWMSSGCRKAATSTSSSIRSSIWNGAPSCTPSGCSRRTSGSAAS